MNRADYLRFLNAEYEQWQALLEQIGPERMEQPGVNGSWSFKDLVAHLTGWQPRLIDCMQAAQHGQPEPPPPWPADLQGEDAVNAWIYESQHNRPIGEVLDDMSKSIQQIAAMIAALPEDCRIDDVHDHGQIFHLVWMGDQRFLANEFFRHYRDDHEADVQAWLARIAGEQK